MNGFSTLISDVSIVWWSYESRALFNVTLTHCLQYNSYRTLDKLKSSSQISPSSGVLKLDFKGDGGRKGGNQLFKL